MSESRGSIPSSRSSRHPVNTLDFRRLQSQHETIQSRLLDLRDALNEKDIVIKSQRNTIKMHEEKLKVLQQNNATFRQTITILSEYITKQLSEPLPELPPLPDEDLSQPVDPVSLLGPKLTKKQKKRKAQSSTNRSYIQETSPGAPMASFATAFRHNKGYIRATKAKPIAFDLSLSQNLFEDFSGADFLKGLLDAQLNREDFQKTVKFLLGKVSREVLMFQTKTILFETLSLFLSSRNVAFQNASETFLPRVMEMLLDVLEVERVVLFVYDPNTESFYSRAVTADLPEQLIIPRDFGHLSLLYESQAAITIQNAYEDPKFDAAYDQMSATITQNLCCVPIRVGEKLIGALECSNKRRPFGTTDLVVMTLVAKQIGIGLAGAEAGEKMKGFAERAPGNRGSIDSAKDALLLPLFQIISVGVQVQVSCERVTIFLYDSSTRELYSIYGTALDGIIRMPTTRGLASLAFTSKSVVNVQRAEENPMFNADIDQKTGFTTREVLAVPIGSKGVLECVNKKNLTPFSKSDESRAATMAQVLHTLFDSSDNLEGVLLNCDFNELCMQAVKIAVIQVTASGLLQKVNKFAAEIFNLTPERMVGMTLTELLCDSQELLSDFLNSVSKGGSGNYKGRKLCVTRDTRQRTEAVVNCSILQLAGLADGPAFVMMLHPQGK